MEIYTVMLEKNHTHQGILYPAGTELTVSKVEADFLAEHHVVKKISSKPAVKKTVTQEHNNAKS